MSTPHELYRQVFNDSGDSVAAIKAVREKFSLDLTQAKQVMLQVDDINATLNEHQSRLLKDVDDALRDL